MTDNTKSLADRLIDLRIANKTCKLVTVNDKSMSVLNVISTIWKNRVHNVFTLGEPFENRFCYTFTLDGVKLSFSTGRNSFHYENSKKYIVFNVYLHVLHDYYEPVSIFEWYCGMKYTKYCKFMKENSFFMENFPSENLMSDEDVCNLLSDIGVQI